MATTDWPFDQGRRTAAIATRQVLGRDLPILQVTHFADDHSWAFVCGTEDYDQDGRVVAPLARRPDMTTT